MVKLRNRRSLLSTSTSFVESVRPDASSIQLQRWWVGWGLPGLVVLLFLGCVGTISLTRHPIGDYGVETDFYWDYAPAADALLHGELPIERYSFRGPGYPLILAVGKLFTSDTFLAGKFVSLVAAAACLWMIYQIFKPLLGYVWAATGMILIAMNGIFIEYAVRVGTDMFFMALNLLFFVLLGIGRSRKTALAAGVVAGYAFITRYNGAALILTLMVWAIFRLRSRNQEEKIQAMLAGAGLFVMVVPWLALLYLTTGDPFHNLNSANILYTITAAGKVPWDQFWYADQESLNRMVPPNFMSRLTLFAWYYFQNFTHHFVRIGDEISGWLVMTMGLVAGVLIIFRRLKIGEWRWMLIGTAFNYLILSTLFFSARFFLALMPLIFGLSLVLWSSRERLRLGKARIVVTVAGMLAIGSIMVIDFPKNMNGVTQRLSHDPVEVLKFTRHEELRGISGSRMAARKPHFAYLTGNSFIPLPLLDSVDSMVKWMREESVSYIFLDDRGANTRPALWKLLGSPKSTPELEMIAYSPKPAMGLWKLK